MIFHLTLIQFKNTMKTLFILGACVIIFVTSTNLRQNYNMYPQNSFSVQPFLNPFSYFPYYSYFPNYNTGMGNTPMQIPSIPRQIPNIIPNQAPNAQSPLPLTVNPSPVIPGTVAPSFPTNPVPLAPNNDLLSLMGLYTLPQQNNYGRMGGDNIFSSLLGSLNPILQSLSANSTNSTNTTDTHKGNDVLINNVKVGLTPTPNPNNTTSQPAINSTTVSTTNGTLNQPSNNNSTNQPVASSNTTDLSHNATFPVSELDTHSNKTSTNTTNTTQDQNKKK